MDFDGDGPDAPTKFRFRPTGVEYMLASDVAKLLGKPLSHLFALYPSLSRRKASIGERNYLADMHITNTAVVSLVKASEVDELLLRKKSSNNPFAAVPKSSNVPRPDKGFVLTSSEHVMPREATALTENGSNRKKSENIISKHFSKAVGLAGTQIGNSNESLIPIRLTLDYDAYKVKDTFVWNADDKVVLPKTFAIQYCHDEELPNNFVELITDAITAQIDEYKAVTAVNLEGRSITVELNVQVGTILLQDKFVWSHNETSITPESFAEILCADLGISGEFPGLIAHAIREQLLLDRKSALQEEIGDYLHPYQIQKLSDCFRIKEDETELWSPMLSQSTWAEVEKLEKEADREARRRKRTQEDLVANSSGRRSARARRDVPHVSYVQSNRSASTRVLTDTLHFDANDTAAFPSTSEFKSPAPSASIAKYLKKHNGIEYKNYDSAAELSQRNTLLENTTNPVFSAAYDPATIPAPATYVPPVYVEPTQLQQHQQRYHQQKKQQHQQLQLQQLQLRLQQQHQTQLLKHQQQQEEKQARASSNTPVYERLSQSAYEKLPNQITGDLTGFNRPGYYKDNMMNRRLGRVGHKKARNMND